MIAAVSIADQEVASVSCQLSVGQGGQQASVGVRIWMRLVEMHAAIDHEPLSKKLPVGQEVVSGPGSVGGTSHLDAAFQNACRY
jgi:hypothetical protein